MQENIIKSNQEQAVASWVNYLNQIRLDRLTAFMQTQDINLDEGMKDLDSAVKEIHQLITSNRGGVTGMHGFIAEAAEVGIGNARQNILGNPDYYVWSNDNGMVDLIREGVDIQQKFYQSGLSLGAIAAHLKRYPDFLTNGSKYQIPKDQYEQLKYLMNLSKEEANKMPTADGTFSLKQWKAVHEFFDQRNIEFNDVEPSLLEYKEVQKGQINNTILNERENIKDTDEKLRSEARQNSMPSLSEGVKVTAVSAAVEGTSVLVMTIIEKKRERHGLKNFTNEDWIEVVAKSGMGTMKGGIRGASIYGLTNFTATPAAVANSLVTASFGIAEQTHQYRKGTLSELELIENSEMLCLDAAVSGLSSFVGQAMIPIPVVGAVIGNTVGSIMYKIAKENFKEKEQEIFREYYQSICDWENQLDEKLRAYLDVLESDMTYYIEIIEQLYSVDIAIAFDGSVKLAKSVGVPTSEILDTIEKVDSFFMD